jgi:hypothetical protein
MGTLRLRPPPQRRILNLAGLFFKEGTWTPYASEATTFSTLREALRVRNLFGLQRIKLVAYPDALNDSLNLTNVHGWT